VTVRIIVRAEPRAAAPSGSALPWSSGDSFPRG
jgi:hypothetical protein